MPPFPRTDKGPDKWLPDKSMYCKYGNEPEPLPHSASTKLFKLPQHHIMQTMCNTARPDKHVIRDDNMALTVVTGAGSLCYA